MMMSRNTAATATAMDKGGACFHCRGLVACSSVKRRRKREVMPAVPTVPMMPAMPVNENTGHGVVIREARSSLPV